MTQLYIVSCKGASIESRTLKFYQRDASLPRKKKLYCYSESLLCQKKMFSRIFGREQRSERSFVVLLLVLGMTFLRTKNILTNLRISKKVGSIRAEIVFKQIQVNFDKKEHKKLVEWRYRMIPFKTKYFLSPPFLSLLSTHTRFPFSIITRYVEMTYQNDK